MEIEQQIRFLKVFTQNGKYYLDGYALNSIDFGTYVTGEEDALYEFSMEKINEMANNYMRRDPSVQLELEFQPIQKKQTELENMMKESTSQRLQELKEMINKL